jgi:hypothetical protein
LTQQHRFNQAYKAADADVDDIKERRGSEANKIQLAINRCLPADFEKAMRNLQQLRNDLDDLRDVVSRWQQMHSQFLDAAGPVSEFSPAMERWVPVDRAIHEKAWADLLDKMARDEMVSRGLLDVLQERWDWACKERLADALPGGGPPGGTAPAADKAFLIVDADGAPIGGGTIVLTPKDDATTPRRVPDGIKIADDGTVKLTPKQVEELKDYTITVKPTCHQKASLTVEQILRDAEVKAARKPIKLWFNNVGNVSYQMIVDALREQYNVRPGKSDAPFKIHTSGTPPSVSTVVYVYDYEPMDQSQGCATPTAQGPGPDNAPSLTTVKTPDGKTVVVETDQPRIVKGPAPNDPLATSRGAWGQDYPDQWYLKAVRWLKDDGTTVLPEKASLVTVAVIDTGVDFTHPELMGAQWVNPNAGARGDRYGWNFVDDNADIRDNSGHGTHVAGVIAAASGNRLGIAGINPWARIMALKAMDLDGTGGSIELARAIVYAADHGARVINLSVGGRVLTRHEQGAIDYAARKGALVVVAAGNEGDDTAKYSPAGLKNVLAVSVVGPDLKRRPFSNWGRNVAIAAPGAEILSLRARRTDVLLVLNPDYKAGNAIVAKDYYRITGSSFATPIVAGAAALLFSINPSLSAEQVKRMLLQSARDLDSIGTNQFSGYGLLDIEAAVKADPDFFVDARIDGVSVAQVGGRQVVRVSGTANADRMKEARIEIGAGENPKQWKKVGRTIGKPVVNGVIGDLPVDTVRGAKQWTLRIIVTHRNGRTREGRFKLALG